MISVPGDEVCATTSDSVLALASGWNIVEFNVFGDLTFHTAVFDPGTSLTVRTRADNTKGITPVAVLVSFTGETNSLDLVRPACNVAGAITFRETNVAGEKYICPMPPTKAKLCQEADEALAFDQKALDK